MAPALPAGRQKSRTQRRRWLGFLDIAGKEGGKIEAGKKQQGLWLSTAIR